MVRLIHITPELPPTVGGVADYAAILSQRLIEVAGGAIDPVLVHAGNRVADRIDVSFPVTDLSGRCSAAALADAIKRLADDAEGRAVVLVEYSGYGYAKRGAPWWLFRGLRRGTAENGPLLLTMFHELYATGSPWTSAFWMSFGQAYVARRIANCSEGMITNRADSAQWLRQVAQGPVRHVPVFSNVGEPSPLSTSNDQNGRAVVFGGTGKNSLYAEHGRSITECLDTLGIDTLVDIGPPPREQLIESIGTNVNVRGVLSKDDVSECLHRASVGFLCRNPRALTKSGSLAAYMAHGVPSIVAARHSMEANPDLEEGVHYVSLTRALENGQNWDKQDWALIGRRGRTWYEDHAHSRKMAHTVLTLVEAIL